MRFDISIYKCPQKHARIQYTQIVSPYRLMADKHQDLIYLLKKKNEIALFLKVCPRTIIGDYVAYDKTMKTHVTGQFYCCLYCKCDDTN